MFTRAIEDNFKRHGKYTGEPILLNKLNNSDNVFTHLDEVFNSVFRTLNIQIPVHLFDLQKLNVFDKIYPSEFIRLFQDFYVNPSNSFYSYDFSLISNHALSRIYEKYVSILKIKETPQQKLFGDIPEEKINKSSGTFYTPQYIAKFFAKYLQKELVAELFQNIKIAEPAVGSGIFIRTLLETQIDSNEEVITDTILDTYLRNIIAIDIDENACQATKLSISLLYLVFTDKLPKSLNIYQKESIQFWNENFQFENSFDVVVSNPPFIKNEGRGSINKARFEKYMSNLFFGKADEYLLFLNTALSILKPGGHGLFVIPHSFLINNSAEGIRKRIAEHCNIKFIADLSSISVFENVSIYVALIVFQKKFHNDHVESCWVLKCKSSVGSALEDVLKSNEVTKSAYSIYKLPQKLFKNRFWFILSRNEHQLKEKIEIHPLISEFLDVKQGVTTSADEVFIVDSVIPGEEMIYKTLIPDRAINAYTINERLSKRFVIYPYNENARLDEKDFESAFPKTWAYLNLNKHKLEPKPYSKRIWWELERPRNTEILQPKISTPHIVIMPKYAIDTTGDYIVTRSPYLTLKPNLDNVDLLYYFLGVLNSTPCFWYVSTHSHKYGGNYTRLEVSTLKATPVPDPNKIGKKELLQLIRLVKSRLQANEANAISIEKQIDELVCDLYNLSEEDKNLLLGF
jgi:type I restriction-modification system DNA methylase subunit